MSQVVAYGCFLNIKGGDTPASLTCDANWWKLETQILKGIAMLTDYNN